MVIQEFKSNDTVNRLWWLHDSFWHAAIIKELGPDRANQFNLEISEKIFRMLTITLLREKIIERPRSIQELMFVFKTVWKNAFFDELYVNEPITYEGDTAGHVPDVMSMILSTRQICYWDINAVAKH
jgi:hypothetical protein